MHSTSRQSDPVLLDTAPVRTGDKNSLAVHHLSFQCIPTDPDSLKSGEDSTMSTGRAQELSIVVEDEEEYLERRRQGPLEISPSVDPFETPPHSAAIVYAHPSSTSPTTVGSIPTPNSTTLPDGWTSFSWSMPSALTDSVAYVCASASRRPLFVIRLPDKRTLTVADEYGDVVAKAKWPKWPAKPSIRFNKDGSVRLKDWIVFDKEAKCNYVFLRGDRYYFDDSANGGLSIFKSPPSTPSAQSTLVGFIRNSSSSSSDVAPSAFATHTISLSLSRASLALLEEFVILSTILHVAPNMATSKWRDGLSTLGTGVSGAVQLGDAVVN